MKYEKILKKLTIIFFFGAIFIVPLITLITPDKKISEIENKILTQKPELTFNNILNKKFMNELDKYSVDQFPKRENFLMLKNSYNYLIGNKEFRDIYINKNNRFVEKFLFNKTIVDKNISDIQNLSFDLKNKYNINSTMMVVPTSIAFYEDNLYSSMISDNQENALDYINDSMSKSSLKFYSPYEVLRKYKDEYIYFNTDHHWTQLGAKLAYGDLYDISLDDNFLYDNYEKVADDFYGTYYSKALLPNIKGDEIYAYSEFDNFSIEIDFIEKFDTLYSNKNLNTKNKYQYFLHGDPAFAIINGNKNLDKEILIFKDSYAHNFIPFLTSNYSKIHVVDPRYYNIDIDKYLNENKNIDEVLFINNIQSFNSINIFK